MSYEVLSALHKCSQTSSSNEKLAYLKAVSGDQDFKHLCEIIFDPFITFGAYSENKYGKKDIPEEVSETSPGRRNLIWVTDLMKSLSKREFVGNEARAKIEELIEDYPPTWRPWIYGFFSRELSSGVADGLIKKIFPGLIFDREVQLADGYNPERLVQSNWWAEPKLDGMRVEFFKLDEEYVATSRAFKKLHTGNFLHIIEELKPILDKGFVVDTEVMFEKDWSKSISVAKSQFDHPNRLGLKAYVFDFYPVAYIKNNPQDFSMVYEERRELLSGYLLNGPFCHCFLTFSSYVGNNLTRIANLKDYYVNKGYEGIVLKKVGSTYNFSRDGQWMKAKKSGRDDFKILTVIPGTGKLSVPPSLLVKEALCRNLEVSMEIVNELTCAMGALVVEVNGVPSNVGTGFSEYTRYELMLLHKMGTLEGRWTEIEFHSITKDSALREPVYLDLRIDK